jgi:hypothetical protein
MRIIAELTIGPFIGKLTADEAAALSPEAIDISCRRECISSIAVAITISIGVAPLVGLALFLCGNGGSDANKADGKGSACYSIPIMIALMMSMIVMPVIMSLGISRYG